MPTTSYTAFWQTKAPERITDYGNGTTSWIVGLAPETAVTLPWSDVHGILRQRLGTDVMTKCLNPDTPYPSPLLGEKDGEWLKSCNTVGVNVRTIGSFLEVVKYALTLPDHVRGIHLLPIWEPGVVGSLYGMASWRLNTEFYSQELYEAGVVKLEDQLRVVINILHALGKAVGMDVIPHTDRYSEIVLANPDHFEWLLRDDKTIVSHREYLHEEAQGAIYDWLVARGPATPAYATVGHLWRLPEAKRLKILFGHPEDYLGRQRRRIDLVDWLYHRGYEPAPATMAPPYRGLEVDPRPEATTTDAAGRVWRDYRITKPQEMSRVFGPLTRYKLYGRKRDNQDWEIDFGTPHPWVWNYLTEHYAEQQATYGFDFMRGDMSHVQMRAGGVPKATEIDAYYDPLRAVKLKIQGTTPHFAYFAESFLAADGYMAYGSEVEHLVRSAAEVTLGNLQSTVPNSPEFWQMTRQYLKVANDRAVIPAWTVITGDKDDPRFDHFHHFGELERVFTGLFLGLMPMYFSLGFEQRDRHFSRATNEEYTKLYVFQEERGDKSVSGPYRWGTNLELFAGLTRLHQFAAGTLAHLGATRILRTGPDVLAWIRPASDGEGAYLFVVAFGEEVLADFTLTVWQDLAKGDLLFCTQDSRYHDLDVKDGAVSIKELMGGRCYALA
ncbi:alpha-amylase family protein [Neolewinella antarctica]|uniref:Uncharacterized protein n=1 Tax=Neolewinella antarctica TaxID=442734 RepID=A0ABX0XB39_9BACT|nr:hypothetical protein [Neolewinella antarctica]NJC26460.1 hypothetical protein [Neolewinella antarctica]